MASNVLLWQNLDEKLFQHVQILRKNFPLVEVMVKLRDSSYETLPFEAYFDSNYEQILFLESVASLIR